MKGTVLATHCIALLLVVCMLTAKAQRKTVFVILDGITADAVEKVETPFLDEIAGRGGYTRAYVGGEKDNFNQSPTVSAVGYNHLLTGTWSNKHNVWDNDIKEPNYHYWNIFRIVKESRPELTTAIFSTWTDNRTKLVGENIADAGHIKLDYSFDGFEKDEVRFPHTKDRKFISEIDELVSSEAARYISDHGPDLSWVYLEYTDDMGHMFGDSPQYYDAIKKADAQVGKIWNAINEREATFGEEWMIVITTDHGRDPETGKSHGKQSDRERTIWIVTNAAPLNEHFKQRPAIVDVMPSILRFMNVTIPTPALEEMDGIPFVGKVSIDNLKARLDGDAIDLTWDAIDREDTAVVFLSTTNYFRDGKADEYVQVGEVKVSDRKFQFNAGKFRSEFYKILVKAPHNWTNTWIVDSLK